MRKFVMELISIISKIRFGFIGNKNKIRIANSVKISNYRYVHINGDVRIHRGCFINPSGGERAFLTMGLV